MTKKHNNLGRIVHRASEEMYATQKIAEVASWPEAINTFRAKLDIQVMNHNGYKESDAVKKRLLRKHETVLKYLENKFGDFYAAYDYRAPLPEVDPALENKIWMCWWQGLDNAPEIVKACIDSVRRNAGNREVIIITEENVSKYIIFPDWILEKVKKGIITKTNLSDLLRLSLLASYGGIWLDSTFFCTGTLDKAVYNAPMFSIKRPDYLHASVAGGMFAGYSLGCDLTHRRVFATIRDFFLNYWQKSNYMIDYLLVETCIAPYCVDYRASHRLLLGYHRTLADASSVASSPQQRLLQVQNGGHRIFRWHQQSLADHAQLHELGVRTSCCMPN